MNELVANMAAGDPVLSQYYGTTTTGSNLGQACTGTWYLTYPYTYQYTHDKTKAAFAVAKKLIVLKLAKADTVEKFCRLVETIEAEL